MKDVSGESGLGYRCGVEKAFGRGAKVGKSGKAVE
jgi:hypothetical protein